MMTSLAQGYSPHTMQQHTGITQGHPMSHNSSHTGQSGPGMSQQMHMGVSAPGPQVSQTQAMMTAIQSGAGGPSAHALQHLSPAQQQQAQSQIYQQQAMFASNPQLQQMHQQQQAQILVQQRHQVQQAQRQALIAQQYGGMPMNMPNGLPAMTSAQFQAMRGQTAPMRPVNLPQHLQAQQQQAEHSLQQQQAQAQHQMMMAQQIALQQQANAQSQAGNNPVQSNQINQQPNQNIQQAQNALLQHHHQQQAHAAAAAAAAAASQQNQGQQHSQAQAQPTQQNAQAGTSQVTPQQHLANLQQHVTPAIIQQRQGERMMKGQCLMKLMLFADHLSNFTSSTNPLESYMANTNHRLAALGAKQRDDLNYWATFVEHFFSPKGVLRHSVWVMDEKSNKQYEITYPALPRYFHTHFESGIKGIQMILEKGSERELPNNNHYIESQKSSFVYWFESGAQVVASGTIKAHFDAQQKIELLEFNTSSHEEYLPRTQVVEAARPLHTWSKEWHKANSALDGKSSPEENKKKSKLIKSNTQPPPDIELPVSKLAEVMIQMNPLFAYSHQNPKLTPSNALDQYVANVAVNVGAIVGQQNSIVARTPAMVNFSMGASPAQAHMQLPGGSPHIGSPAQAPGTQFQNNQHGTSSSGPSANTSPNSSNKRRRPSTVKADDENQINGLQQGTSIKPSPRMGGKRQKGNPT